MSLSCKCSKMGCFASAVMDGICGDPFALGGLEDVGRRHLCKTGLGCQKKEARRCLNIALFKSNRSTKHRNHGRTCSPGMR